VYIGKLGNAYFYKNEIAGQTDFLYGFGTAWIQSSLLTLRNCGGGITAWKGTNTTFVNKYVWYLCTSLNHHLYLLFSREYTSTIQMSRRPTRPLQSPDNALLVVPGMLYIAPSLLIAALMTRSNRVDTLPGALQTHDWARTQPWPNTKTTARDGTRLVER
jgi:hypothetical protein